MRKMKDSGIEWIGQIPEEWEVKRIKNLSSFYNGYAFDSNTFKKEEGLKVIRIGDINDKVDYENCVRCSISNTDLGKFLIKQNDILIAMSGATTGKCCLVEKEEEAYINQRVGIIRSDYYKWIYYSLKTNSFSEYVNTTNIGSAQPNISSTSIGNYYIILPSQKNFNSVVSYLDRKCSEIDSIVRETEQTIEEYKKLKQSLITEVVTGKKRVAADGLSLSNEPRKMKDSGVEWIGEVPEEWEIVRLKSLGTCQNGISKSAEYFGEEYEYPFVNYTDAYNNYVVPQPKGRANSSKEDRTRYSLKEGDVLFTRTSETIEEIGYASTCMDTIENAVFSGFLIRFRPTSTDLFKGYSKYYFRSSHLRRYFVKEMNLVTRASLSQQLLKGMSVLLPSLTEQHLIATYLDAKCSEIDKLIADKQTLLQELDTYKKSLIYECVTGKREIN